MTQLVATVHIRTRNPHDQDGNCRTDAYVAVTIAPAGTTIPPRLRQSVLEREGIAVYYFGTGYSRQRGPGSALTQALRRAEAFADAFNAGQACATLETSQPYAHTGG